MGVSNRQPFDQARYWRERHEQFRGDPRSVGNLAASLEENLEGERNYQEIVNLLAGMLKSKVPSTVADLGCGYGRVAKQWIDNGFEYTGIDVSPVAINDARARESRGQFFCADLMDWTPPPVGFGVVTCFYVLTHFVDDANWARFLSRALSVVSDAGVFAFADHFPTEREQKVAHAQPRPVKEYERQLHLYGFSLSNSMRDAFLQLTRDPIGQQLYFASRQAR